MPRLGCTQGDRRPRPATIAAAAARSSSLAASSRWRPPALPAAARGCGSPIPAPVAGEPAAPRPRPVSRSTCPPASRAGCGSSFATRESSAIRARRAATSEFRSWSGSIRFSSASATSSICQVPISFAQATLGAVVEVPTLDGREHLEVPRGTQSGDVLRIKGRGMPDIGGRARGDELVEVVVETPRHLTPRQEELLREFAEIEHQEVSPRRKSFFEKLRDYFTEETESDDRTIRKWRRVVIARRGGGPRRRDSAGISEHGIQKSPRHASRPRVPSPRRPRQASSSQAGANGQGQPRTVRQCRLQNKSPS